VDVLCSIRNYLECGTVRIDNRTTGSLKFTVSGVKDILNKIIPFFDSHPLITSKQLDYQTWRECMIMIAKGLHLTNEGVLKIIELTRTMNSKRSFEERFKFTQSRCPNLKITPEWVQGFSDGEGHFQCSILKGRPLKKSEGHSVLYNITFEVGQNTHDVAVLELLKSFFQGEEAIFHLNVKIIL
jgi:hypothetical protein